MVALDPSSRGMKYQLILTPNCNQTVSLSLRHGPTIGPDRPVEWSIHSDWNYKNKLLLMEAEYHNTQKDYANAAICYETSIKAAQDHKHIHEEAISHELAGTFFFERGLHQKSYLFYRQSIECYKKWGANAVVRRLENILFANFDTDLMRDICPIETVFLPVPPEEKSTRKKRLFSENS